MVSLENMHMSSLKFYTFEAENIYVEADSLNWEPVFLPMNGQCFTLTIPSNITNLGIYQLVLNGKTGSIYDIFVHQSGLLQTDLPGASPQFNFESKRGHSYTMWFEKKGGRN